LVIKKNIFRYLLKIVRNILFKKESAAMGFCNSEDRPSSIYGKERTRGICNEGVR
jgi:hypothetical protein